MSFPAMSGSGSGPRQGTEERSAPTGIGQSEATPPRVPGTSNPGTEESPRTCCTCCCCLHELSLRPASRTPRPLNQGAAPRCYWHSRSSGRRPVRWRWPGPGGERPQRVGPGTCAWALALSPTWRAPWPAFRLQLQGPLSHPGSTLSLQLSQVGDTMLRSFQVREGGRERLRGH